MDIYGIVKEFLGELVTILAEMSPYLLLGFFFAGLLHAFMPRSRIERYFNGSPFRSALYASVFGIPLPLCSCGVIPTGSALYRNGASRGATVSFLISTPQTGVDSILATYSLLGLPLAIIRPLAAFVTGIFGGTLTGILAPDRRQRKHTIEPEEKSRQPKRFTERVVDTFRYGFVEFIQDISKWLVIGLLLAAVISALIPDNFFRLLNLSPLLQMLIILLVSIPFYICATGSIPLAAVLMLKGLSPGAAFVLLMAGPATNAATITVIGKVLGRRSLVVYLGTIVAGALLFGLAIDYLLPGRWFLGMLGRVSADHQHGTHLAWWQLASGVAFILMILNGYIRRFRSKTKETVDDNVSEFSDASEKLTLHVEGMTCNRCKSNVEQNLSLLSFVDGVAVNLSERTVTVSGDSIKREEVESTIESLGYRVKPNS